MPSRKSLSTKEDAFFKLQLSLSLIFSGLLATLLIAFFIFSHWQAYQTQTQAFRDQYSKTQFEILHKQLQREQGVLQDLYASGDFDETKQKLFLNRLRPLRFGPADQGYYFVLKLNDLHGGDDFARHLLLPPNPSEEGLPMSSAYQDIKGFAYREAYLKQLSQQGFAEVSYWYKKPTEHLISQKISYLVGIRGLDWIIGAGLYSDDLERVVKTQQQAFERQFWLQVVISTGITFLFLTLAWVAHRRIQHYLLERFKVLKQENHEYQQRLENYNQSLSQEVAEKTQILQHIYQSDALTGLFNRAKLVLDLNEYQVQNHEKNTILIMLNIDNFKEVNDVFGFELGDLILIDIAQNLKRLMPMARCYYRVGGDEFVIWLDQLPEDLEESLIVLHRQITQDIRHQQIESISFNVTLAAVVDADSPLNQLEMTMDRAKKTHKNVLVYSKNLDQSAFYQTNLLVTQRIRAAIQNDQVVPYFQPILNCQTLQIEKYECLIRIENGEELLSPVNFLQIAKKSKLYAPLMIAMLEKSFAQFSQPELSHYGFSVNLSYEDIVGQEIPEALNRLLTPLNAKRVNFEILETEGIENYALVSSFIQGLKAKGSSIAIDDYGSGYSNLEHLLKLNVDVIKLDGSLIQSLPQPHALAIVNSVVTFAKQLQIKTVAEFVSNKALFELIKSLGVDYAQGYYVGEPQPQPQQVPFRNTHSQAD